MKVKGAAYLHILTPCNVGWGFASEKSIEMARLTVNTGLFPIIEYVNGELTAVEKIKKLPVEAALAAQKRFKHLTKPEYSAKMAEIQEIADDNIKRYGLCL